MKLFKVDYIGDYECDSYIVVGESEEEVIERETKKLSKEFSCLMDICVFEIDEVDGHKIIVD